MQDSNRRSLIIYPLAAAAVIILDQITKLLVRSGMEVGDRIPVIGSWMSIYYVRNTGTAFSMFSGNRMVTVFFTTALIIACIVFAVLEIRSGSRISAMMLCLISAGGASNLADRLILGYVTDMISCGSFAVFNVADIAVTCGCFLFVFYMLFTEYGRKDKEAGDE